MLAIIITVCLHPVSFSLWHCLGFHPDSEALHLGLLSFGGIHLIYLFSFFFSFNILTWLVYMVVSLFPLLCHLAKDGWLKIWKNSASQESELSSCIWTIGPAISRFVATPNPILILDSLSPLPSHVQKVLPLLKLGCPSFSFWAAATRQFQVSVPP